DQKENVLGPPGQPPIRQDDERQEHEIDGGVEKHARSSRGQNGENRPSPRELKRDCRGVSDLRARVDRFSDSSGANGVHFISRQGRSIKSPASLSGWRCGPASWPPL